MALTKDDILQTRRNAEDVSTLAYMSLRLDAVLELCRLALRTLDRDEHSELPYDSGYDAGYTAAMDDTVALVKQAKLSHRAKERMERNALASRVGMAVLDEVLRDNVYGPCPADTLDVQSHLARTAGDFAVSYLLRAISNVLRDEESER
jgi:hypothetical protein